MQKPVSIARVDFMNQVCDAINNSGLPAFLIVDVLERILHEVERMAEAEYKSDCDTWEKARREIETQQTGQ